MIKHSFLLLLHCYMFQVLLYIIFKAKYYEYITVAGIRTQEVKEINLYLIT